jgi:hypothetical protein
LKSGRLKNWDYFLRENASPSIHRVSDCFQQ